MEYLVESQRDLVNSSVCCQCIINQGGNHKDICSCKQGHTTSPCTNNCPSNCFGKFGSITPWNDLRIFRISFKVLLCLMLLFLTSCSNVEYEYHYELSNDEMIEEYDLMWKELENNFIVYLNLLLDRGVDYKEIKQFNREKLENPTIIKDFNDYHNVLLSMIEDLKYEGHLNLLGYNRFMEMYNGANNDFLTKKEEKILYSAYNDKSYKRYKDINNKQDQNIYSNYNSSEIELFNIIHFEGSDILYIKYGDFYNYDKCNINEEIEKTLAGKIYNKIILDFRNNPGGLTTNMNELIALFSYKNIVDKKYERFDGKENIEYLDILTSKFYNKAFLKKIKESLKENDNLKNIDFTKEEKYMSLISKDEEKAIVEIENIIKPKNYIDENTEVYILQGKDYSASNFFKRYMLRNYDPVIIGIDSGMDGSSAIRREYMLKHSGLVLEYCVGVECDKNGEVIDTIIKPDFYLSYDSHIYDVISFVNDL